MADFTDVVESASPALIRAQWPVTEGKTWRTAIVIPADLTGVSGEARALDAIDGTTVVVFTVTVEVIDADWSTVTLEATTTASAGTGGTSPRKRVCPMYLTLSKGGQKADVFGVQESVLIISQGA